MKVYMGYDAREDVAYRVASWSIRRQGVEVIPLKHKELRDQGLFERPWNIDSTGQMYDSISNTPVSTEFSFTRFLVPHLCQDSYALFVDSDILAVANLGELFSLADERYAIQVVKHKYQSPYKKKMDGVVQQNYSDRKLWSSLILWNLRHESNAKITIQDVNSQSGKFLHEFQWLKDEEIGELPSEWNHLPGHNNQPPKLIHWTEGGPWRSNYADAEYADLWHEAYYHTLKEETENAYRKLVQ